LDKLSYVERAVEFEPHFIKIENDYQLKERKNSLSMKEL